jgi:peptide-methionine (S)-S-oxide reductase
MMTTIPTTSALATFGAGCFWGVEAAFAKQPGVLSTSVGYMGGTVDHPTYQQVCTDTTGHAEVVQVIFDPHQITYPDLLAVFWRLHDPTQLNRQGPDVGRQYRSVIFTHSDGQYQQALTSKAALALGKPVVTVVESAGSHQYWPAEGYHQQYFKRHPVHCHI